MIKKIEMLITFLFCFAVSSASTVIHNYACDKEQEIKNESGVYNDDYLFLGKELNFSGQSQDLVFLGKRLTFTGTTTLGLITLCEKSIISGTNGNGIIAAGADILVGGSVKSTSYIAGKSFHLAESGTMDGDVFAGCAKLLIDGTINGNLYAVAGQLIINNVINGNVTAYGGRIIIGEKGKINGNLTYSTKEKLPENAISKVSGTVKYDEKHKNDFDEWKSFTKSMKTFGILIGIFFYVSFIVIGLLLLFLPIFKNLEKQLNERSFWITSLWGIIPILMYPALTILCFIFVFTIPLGLVLLLLLIPMFFFANIIGTTLVGKYLVGKLKWNVNGRHYQFLIGTVAGIILTILPFMGFLSFLFISSLGWGVMISNIMGHDLSDNKNVSVDQKS